MNSSIRDKISKLINSFNSAHYDLVINKISILLKTNPNNDFLWNLQGLTFQIQKKNKLSIEYLNRAIQINPNNISAINNLGISYKNTMNYPAAENCFNTVLNLNPSHIKTLINFGNLKNETLKFNEAILYYKEAINLDNIIPEAHLSLAYAYQSINKIDEAKQHLNKTLEIDKTLTRADKMLSALTTYTTNNSHLHSMISKIKNLTLTVEKQIYLYFAIAKAFEDIKDFDKSFKYLEKGNQLQRANTPYEFKDVQKLSDSIKSFFLNYKFKDNLDKINKKKIIFIVGMPRSGTTLVEKIISSHSDVTSLGEINIVYNLLFDNIIRDNKIDTLEVDKLLKKDLAKQYMVFLENFEVQNNNVADKTLMNFWFLCFIKYFFPNSKIIHCSRDPKDNCLSIYKNLFDVHQGWLYDQEDLANYYGIYEDIMKFWNKKYDKEIYNIRYENLIKDSNVEIKKIINFCGLKWESECLNFYKKKTFIKTLSFNQANKPIYNSSINSANNYKNKLKTLFSKLN